MLARFGFLYTGYRLPYWETFEMVRKLLLTAIPVFIPAQKYGSTQVGGPVASFCHAPVTSSLHLQ